MGIVSPHFTYGKSNSIFQIVCYYIIHLRNVISQRRSYRNIIVNVCERKHKADYVIFSLGNILSSIHAKTIKISCDIVYSSSVVME